MKARSMKICGILQGIAKGGSVDQVSGILLQQQGQAKQPPWAGCPWMNPQKMVDFPLML